MKRRRIPARRLRATVLLLPVEGEWWAPVAPGVVVCSVRARNRTLARIILDETFESGYRCIGTVGVGREYLGNFEARHVDG